MGLDKDMDKFVIIVRDTLIHSVAPKLENFFLFMRRHPQQHNASLNGFLATSMVRKAKNITLWFRTWQPSFRAPVEFRNYGGVVNLNVGGWDMTFGPVNWPMLKSLTLSDVNLDKETIGVVLSGCPVLETLVLRGYLYLFSLNITSKSVRKLVLLDFEPHESEQEEDQLQIDAPWIQELEISGNWFAFVQLGNVSSLTVSARLSFVHDQEWYKDVYSDDCCTNHVSHMLFKVRRVKHLILGPICIQVLSYLTLRRHTPLMFDCKHLTLESCVERDELHG